MLSDDFKYNPETPCCVDSDIIPTCGGGYWNFTYKGKALAAHRIVWELHNGPIPAGWLVDHKDRNKLNNRIENLRLATKAQNSANSTRKRSLPKGVYSLGLRNGAVWYRGQVTINKKSHSHPSTTDLSVVTSWANALRLEAYGEFAASQ
ncbi:HNH endonuclease [Pseudomonas sp. MF6772]|uniref:HNH endonuclease n=1 Tax=Pseudomonas TaxID=286 RepID=UPI001472F0F1|nr:MULTISPECIES: HNH endonuclease [Pseudomonas]MBJ2270846.1 HNH endonuclease [Pseudomonas sp. MF6772]MCU0209143.1 HNH endonuclease [Pseudomonas shahriarae]NMY19004.1 endonuclease [Pseudomonas sp. WS 5410]